MDAINGRRAVESRLTGRRDECRLLDALVDSVRSGASRVLVLRGQAGVGKTSLIDYVADNAPGCRVLRTVGMQSEPDLPYAGLHHLLAPALEHLGRLPDPQREDRPEAAA